jgi:hypothetical protein
MATPAPKILVPTRVSEDKRAREEEAARQRRVENGLSILTMWILGHMIQQHRCDFHIGKDCYPVIAVFSTYTNLAESGIQFDRDDEQFLRDFEEEFKREYITNNVEFQEGLKCRELWESFLKTLWASEGFARFAAKFAAKIVLNCFKKPDGAELKISDNLPLLENLTKFLKFVSMHPTLTQQMSSFYASSGLSVQEKTDILFGAKREQHLKHQLKLKDLKLKDCERKLKEEQQMTKNLQAMLKQEQEDMRRLIEQNEVIQQELDALKLALERAGNGNVRVATCLVCMSPDNGKCGMMLTPCCGQPFCELCFETTKKTQGRQNPPCPNCRQPIQNILVRITDSNPIYRRGELKHMISVGTTVDPADFLDEITEAPIPKPDRTLSVYEKLFESLEDQPSAGGGAAMSKPHHRREPPAPRADA